MRNLTLLRNIALLSPWKDHMSRRSVAFWLLVLAVGGSAAASPASAAAVPATKAVCTATPTSTLRDAKAGRFYDRPGSFKLARLIRACRWDRGSAAAAFDAVARNGAVDPIGVLLIGLATRRLASPAYETEAARTVAKLAAAQSPMPIELASVAVDLAAGYCFGNNTRACFSDFSRRMMSAGVSLDPVANLAFGDLLGRPAGRMPSTSPMLGQVIADIGTRADHSGAAGEVGRRHYFTTRYGMESPR